MADLYDSGSIYRYLTQSEAPAWSTPQGLKNAYQNAINVAKAYAAAAGNQLRDYGAQVSVPQSAQFQKLVEMYNRAYRENALQAVREGTKAANRAAAGYGNSYAGTAAQLAYTNAMAQQGNALPKLLAAANKAYRGDKKAKVAALKVLFAQGSAQANAARELSDAQLSAALQKAAAASQAQASRQKSLAHLNKQQLALEKLWSK